MLTSTRHFSQGRQDAYVAPPMRNRVLATLFASSPTHTHVAGADMDDVDVDNDASTVIQNYSLSAEASIYSPYCTQTVREVMDNVCA